MMSSAEKWIYWLDEVTKEHCNLVGKKCAHLGEMTRAGFSVPQGFALTLDGYTSFLKETGALDEMCRYLSSFKADPHGPSDLPKWEEASNALRPIVESKPMPAAMAKPLVHTMQRSAAKRALRTAPWPRALPDLSVIPASTRRSCTSEVYKRWCEM